MGYAGGSRRGDEGTSKMRDRFILHRMTPGQCVRCGLLVACAVAFWREPATVTKPLPICKASGHIAYTALNEVRHPTRRRAFF